MPGDQDPSHSAGEMRKTQQHRPRIAWVWRAAERLTGRQESVGVGDLYVEASRSEICQGRRSQEEIEHSRGRKCWEREAAVGRSWGLERG